MTINIFVIGLDEFNQAKLEKLADSYRFQALLSVEDTKAHRQYPGTSAFILPERPRQPDEAPVTFAEAAGAPPLVKTQLTAPRYGWDVRYDLVADEAALEVIKDEGLYRLDDIDLEIHKKARELYTVNSGRFDSPRGEVWSERRFKRGAWQARTEAYTRLTADEHNFYLHATLDAYEDSRRVFSRNWQRAIPRDHL